MVAEVAAGKRYTDLVREIVFDPLAMERSTFDPTVAMTYPISQSHNRAADGTVTVDHRYADAAWAYPAGFVISNVEDLARFAQMLLGRGAVGDTRLLATESVEEMYRPHARTFLDASSFYGLTIFGHRYKGLDLYSHGGGISSFGTLFQVIPETGTSVIIFVNLPGPLLDPAGLAASIFDELLDLPPGPEATPTYAPSSPERDALAGVYAGPGGIARIRQTDDEALEVEFNGRSGRLNARAADLYVAETQPLPIVVGVVPDAAGGIDMVSVMGQPLARTSEQDLPPAMAADPLECYVGVYEAVTPPIRLEVSLADDQLFVAAIAQGIPPDRVALGVLGGRRFGTPIGALEFDAPADGHCTNVRVAGLELLRQR